MAKLCVFTVPLVLLFTFNARSVESALNATRIAEILASFSSSSQVRMIPRQKSEQVNVTLGFYLLNMVPLTFMNNHIYVEFDLMERWFDPRLKFENSSAYDVVTLQNQDTESIWKPDIIILEENGEKHDSFPSIQSAAWIFPDGTVFYFTRLSITVYCPMSMEMYPFDRQTCALKFESYAYNNQQLRLGFLETRSGSPVFKEDPFEISKFLLHKYEISSTSLDYGLTGFFDQLTLKFYLRRDIRYYIMEYCFPIICVVFLSFLSFWVHFKATPARVALPVTTFLTLTSMLEHVRRSSNIVGTADALEIFMNVSNVFVFANMLEYGIVSVLVRNSKKSKSNVNKSDTKSSNRPVCKDKNVHWENENNITSCTSNEENAEAKSKMDKNVKESSRKLNLFCLVLTTVKHWFKRKNQESCEDCEEAHFLDKICRYLFPFLYLSFIIVHTIVCAVNLLN